MDPLDGIMLKFVDSGPVVAPWWHVEFLLFEIHQVSTGRISMATWPILVVLVQMDLEDHCWWGSIQY
jgi:hypothetical protein